MGYTLAPPGESLYIKRGKVRMYVRTSVTVGMASSVANDVTMTIAGLWRYGDWRYVATGCTALVRLNCPCVAAMRPLVKLV